MSIDTKSQAVAAYNRGVSADRAGDKASAVTAFQMAVGMQPGFFQAWNNLGIVLEETGRTAEAANAYRLALAANSRYPTAWRNLARVSQELGEWQFASECLDQLGLMEQNNWGVQLARLQLPRCYRSAAEIDATRTRFKLVLDELLRRSSILATSSEAEQCAKAIERHDNFFLAYQGECDRELQTKYGKLVRSLRNVRETESRRISTMSSDRIRVGFASCFFRQCTVGNYFRSWILDIDPNRFEVTVFLLGGPEDSLTEEIRAAANRTLRMDGTLADVAMAISNEGMDILIYPELGMNGRTYSLAAQRLAPIQCAAWGHPVTTGLPTIDYFFSCKAMEPDDAQSHYAEILKLLPGLGTRYTKPMSEGTVTRSAWNLPEKANLYLFPHPPYKVHPENDRVVCEILQRDTQGVLVICAGVDAVANRIFTERLEANLDQLGLPRDRLRVLPHMPRASYIALNRLCEVMLDTSRWSGGNTTLDALAVGLPVVTRRGRFMRGRQSAGMLNMIGIEELIAEDEAQFVDIAVSLALNPEKRKRISDQILTSHPRLFDDSNPIAALEQALVEIVMERQ